MTIESNAYKKEFTETTTQEKGVWLGDSIIWKQVGAFYQDTGISAWESAIPYLVTSNPRIAASYVEMALAFMEDWMRQNGKLAATCQFVELGAGHGSFALMMLRALAEREKDFRGLGVRVRYLLTDLAAVNVEAWKSDPWLKNWLNSDEIQVAQFDCMQQQPDLKPINSEEGPIIFIANYLFDSLPHEAFLLEGKEILRAETFITANAQSKDPNDWKMSLDFKPCPIESLEETTTELLEEYRKLRVQGCVLIPVGAVQCIENLRQLSNDRFLLLCSDKALSTENSIQHRNPAEITAFMHASMLVNLHALMLYFQRKGGCAWMQKTQQQSLSSAAFSMGVDSTQMRHTDRAFSQQLDQNSPGDLYNLSTQLLEQRFSLNLGSMLSLLKLMEWDALVFEGLYDAILAYLPSATGSEVSDLLDALPLIAERRYPLPSSGDTLFHIAHLLQTLQCWRSAIKHYQNRIVERGDSAEVSYNLGLCFNAIEDPHTAKACFQQALELNPDFLLAQGWLYRLNAPPDSIPVGASNTEQAAAII